MLYIFKAGKLSIQTGKRGKKYILEPADWMENTCGAIKHLDHLH